MTLTEARQLLPPLPGEGPADRHLHRPLRGQGPRDGSARCPSASRPTAIPRFEVRLHGPDTAIARPGLRGLADRDLLRGRQGGGPARRLARHAVPVRVDAQEARGLPVLAPTRASRAAGASSRLADASRRRTSTSEAGAATLRLDPTIEPTAAAAHLRGRGHGDRCRRPDRDRDAQLPRPAAVRARPQGAALPAERAQAIDAQSSWSGPRRRARSRASEVTVRLLRREWHSHLRASDFTDGLARYITDVVDVKVQETDGHEREGPARR